MIVLQTNIRFYQFGQSMPVRLKMVESRSELIIYVRFDACKIDR